MTFTAQLNDLTTALRSTRARLLAPIDLRQQILPRDPEIFVEDVIQYLMDEWGNDLRAEGHVLEENTADQGDDIYPCYLLRMVGGDVLQLNFTGNYPDTLFLTIAKGFRRTEQFSESRLVEVQLPVALDANLLMLDLMDGLKNHGLN